MSKILPLAPEKVYSQCNVESLSFTTTADLQPLPEVTGRDRAISTLNFGTRITNPGFNIYAMGAAGTGKHTGSVIIYPR